MTKISPRQRRGAPAWRHQLCVRARFRGTPGGTAHRQQSPGCSCCSRRTMSGQRARHAESRVSHVLITYFFFGMYAMTHADIAQGMMLKTGTSFRSRRECLRLIIDCKGAEIRPFLLGDASMCAACFVICNFADENSADKITNGNKEERRCLVTSRDFNMNTHVLHPQARSRGASAFGGRLAMVPEAAHCRPG